MQIHDLAPTALLLLLARELLRAEENFPLLLETQALLARFWPAPRR